MTAPSHPVGRRFAPPRAGRRGAWCVALAAALAATVPAVPAAASYDPANEPPFGGGEVPPLIAPASPAAPPPGFSLSAVDAIATARATAEYEEAVRDHGELRPTAATRGDDVWEVRFRDGDGEVRALVVVDDAFGQVIEAWTGTQIETELARGYEDAVSGDLNEWWFWLPLCVVFLAPFVDPRRPFRLIHLDLLALLGFSASLFFFNKGEIGVSAPLVYPFLLYLLARMLFAGFVPRESRDALVPFAPRGVLVAGIVALAGLHAWFAIEEAKVIDVGTASVIGADLLAGGDDVYGEAFGGELPATGDVRGDVYGPVTYLAYVPAEQAFPWEDEWDDVPAARAASLLFDLLTAAALLLLGARLRDGPEGRTLGVALAFAWLAYPFALYTLGSSFNDSLVALTIVACMLALASPPGRGALAALSGLTKFGSLALAPLFAAGRGERSPRALIGFGLAFAAAAALVTLPLLPDGGARELYDRSVGYQASRGAPFSLWGQAPSLEPLQSAVKVLAVALALAVFFVPRRRSAVQVAALGAAVLIGVQLTANHWFYPYAVWFAPLVLAAVFAVRGGPEPPVGGTGPDTVSRTSA